VKQSPDHSEIASGWKKHPAFAMTFSENVKTLVPLSPAITTRRVFAWNSSIPSFPFWKSRPRQNGLPGGAHAGAACTRLFRAHRRLPLARLSHSISRGTPSLAEPASSRHQLYRRPETPIEKEMLRGEIESTDQAIDALVYQLYSLTEAEIKIVEGL
jgi:hypothetical protein